MLTSLPRDGQASATFLALNWFAASSKQMATSFQPFTKSALSGRRVTLFSLTAPSEAEIRRFISKQKDSGFWYPEVGASVAAAPAGYNVDHNRIQLS